MLVGKGYFRGSLTVFRSLLTLYQMLCALLYALCDKGDNYVRVHSF